MNVLVKRGVNRGRFEKTLLEVLRKDVHVKITKQIFLFFIMVSLIFIAAARKI